MLSVGALIWISIRPLLRLVLCTSSGYIITKADIFPAVAARGTGQILLNILMPCLMFSKIVPSFTSDNVSALGPLILVASIYEILGVVIAWTIKQFFWVPHRFRHGMLVAGGWSNVGDVPTAVVLSITGAAPFNGTSDQNVAVAYISVFILVFFVSLFPMGGHRLIALDYVGPEVDDEDVRMSMIAKTKQTVRQWTHGVSAARRLVHSSEKKHVEDTEAARIEKSEKVKDTDIEVSPVSKKDIEGGESELDATGTLPSDVAQRHVHMRAVPHKHVSFGFAESTTTAVPTEPFSSRVCSPAHTEAGPSCVPSRVTSPAPSVTHVDGDGPSSSRFQRGSNLSPASVPESVGPSTTVAPRSRAIHHRILAYARTFAISLLTIQAITIFTAFPIALITPLKALFTTVDISPIPNAPDGEPPLAFILDTATFIGNASVPTGLICLGSALARLNVPRSQWKYLPWGAISWLAIGKMVLMPILGILITQGFVHVGIIGEDQKVLRFVCMFLSCIPTATTQVYLTQVYSGTGSADTISAFLIPQYALMFVTMTVLCAYSLQLIF